LLINWGFFKDMSNQTKWYRLWGHPVGLVSDGAICCRNL